MLQSLQTYTEFCDMHFKNDHDIIIGITITYKEITM